MDHFKNYFFFLVILFSLSFYSHASEKKLPSTFAVYQQEGPVCPYISWVNLDKVRQMRTRGGGKITFQDSDYSTKINSYAKFLPRLRVLDQMYDNLRSAGGAYAQYEKVIRTQGIISSRIFDANGIPTVTMDPDLVSQAIRTAFTPYNILVDPEYPIKRWLPILQYSLTNQLYFYDFHDNKTTQLPMVSTESNGAIIMNVTINNGVEPTSSFSEARVALQPSMLEKMGVNAKQIECPITEQKTFGFKTGYFVPVTDDTTLCQEYYFDVGSFQHMLLACGVHTDNSTFSDEDVSLEAMASRELQEAIKADPRNPWADLVKEDLFEYHLAEIFKDNEDLKYRTMAAVDYYNNYWQIYEESFDFYDAPAEPRTKLSQKQRFMPGKDQMLAYLFSNQLRFLWAATISSDAVQAIEGVEERIPEAMSEQLHREDRNLREFDAEQVILSALYQKFGIGDEQFSFFDMWKEIRALFLQRIAPLQKQDFVTFSNHGSVISFDQDLVQLQHHETPHIAKELGFAVWDSLYEKVLRPFYQRPGTEEDVIKF